MDRKTKRSYALSCLLFLLFVSFTLTVSNVDVRPIGPAGSAVGLASVNQYLYEMIGADTIWYQISELLGIIPLMMAGSHMVAGACQLIRYKRLQKVDPDIILLGIFYALVLVIYVSFEIIVINHRPILTGGQLEPSYPSSHTMLSICIMGATAIHFRNHFPTKKNACLMMDIFAWTTMLGTVASRSLSGVHWPTDIFGGVILSCAMISLYFAVSQHCNK
jgi:undecaprenyl-diphosphatase